MNEAYVEFETENQKGSITFLRPEIIKEINVNKSEINPNISFSFPGTPYTETGVANPGHECTGSVCATFIDNNQNKISIDEIFYYDQNINRNHNYGLPHWNHETRIKKNGKDLKWFKKNSPHHIIPDSPNIKISVYKNNNEIYTTTITQEKTENKKIIEEDKDVKE